MIEVDNRYQPFDLAHGKQIANGFGILWSNLFTVIYLRLPHPGARR